MQRGEIKNRKYAAQLRNFSGLVYGTNGTITPTDIDGLIEYEDKCFVFIEAKYEGAELPYGQRLALERLVDSLDKPSVLFIANHCSKDDIDMAATWVTDYYYLGEWIQVKPVYLKFAIRGFLRTHGAADF